MLKIIEKGNKREIIATEGYVIRKGETPSKIRQRGILPTESIEDYEEILELPKYTEAEYKAKVQELIAERYSISDEIALINNLKGTKNEYLVEYDEYMQYRNECKEKAKNLLNNTQDELQEE